MEKIKFSIITVCFNSVETVEQTIQSVIGQNHKNIEYIIIDGGSTDGSVEVIKKYSSHIACYISEPDQGIYDAMNKGIARANGEVIGILNSDDIFFDNSTISKLASAFQTQKTDVVYGDIIISAKNNMNKHIRKWIAGKRKSFLWGWHPPHPGLFIKNSVYKKCGIYNINYDVSADFDLMLRLFEVNKVSAYYLKEFIVNMRTGGESSGTIKKIIIGNLNIKKSFHANNVTYLWVYPFIRVIKKITQFIK